MWTLGALRARPWTVLDILAMLCKQGVSAAAAGWTYGQVAHMNVRL
jgi:hypothetical protein